MKTVESYLPVFPGYYSTHFESDHAEEMVLENLEEDGTPAKWEAIEFDHKEYRDRVAKACISSVWNFLKNDGFELDIIFDEVYSPREYNFSNDVINCTYKISKQDFNKLVEYCKTNLEAFKDYLKDKYSSYSGFVSFFSTSSKKWFNEYLNEDSDKFEQAFAGILDFYLMEEGV